MTPRRIWLVVALAAALTSCSSADPGDDGSPDAPTATESSSADVETSEPQEPTDDASATDDAATAEESAGDGSATDDSSADAAAGDSDPADAAGVPELTEEEQSFVEESDATQDVYVPAVVEAGREACQRMTSTAALDSDALVSALIGGQIPDGENAIRNLCPELSEHLDRALSGFADGTFAVADDAMPGERVAPGSYTAIAPSETCSVTVYGDGDAAIGSGAAEGGSASVRIPREAERVESSGCYAWVPAP